MIAARLFAPVILALAACAHETPSDALARYRQAVAARDVDRILALSDASFRAAYSADELRALLAKDPRAFDHAVARLETAARSTRERAEVELADGSRVTLVREEGAWRVSSGALQLASFATPELALSSFFHAVDGKNWELVRRAIPKRHASLYAADAALEAYLADLKPRLDRARAALGTPASIAGTKAQITYDDAKRVTFEREDDGWRIVDLE